MRRVDDGDPALAEIYGDVAHLIPLHNQCIYRGCIRPPKLLVVTAACHMYLCRRHAVQELGLSAVETAEQRAAASGMAGIGELGGSLE